TTTRSRTTSGSASTCCRSWWRTSIRPARRRGRWGGTCINRLRFSAVAVATALNRKRFMSPLDRDADVQPLGVVVRALEWDERVRVVGRQGAEGDAVDVRVDLGLIDDRVNLVSRPQDVRPVHGRVAQVDAHAGGELVADVQADFRYHGVVAVGVAADVAVLGEQAGVGRRGRRLADDGAEVVTAGDLHNLLGDAGGQLQVQVGRP